ncbi:uncharacterized protein Tco025E_03575 [Trypanosoma conorhini]|uniref:FAD-dependent oxidoreductase domain-containing protein 1 n=1 Tax=Trypanosoma conorhini TaxID=83891 RepID=A0A3R7S404_9TRYP|nr:uncharacterized protein Tco025E_03575 [Trypanosoma conorhini]RNF20845.1 hypothetical protein Tco025E_03575 [Trypanosoma conorhini]
MGIWASRACGTTAVSSAPPHGRDTDALLKDFDTTAPTVAVIGAGMAGVHAAYELAQLGFRVTVFEQRRAVGLGETQYAFPFVGVGLLQPYIHALRMGRELLHGTLKVACPDIISAEGSWNSFFSAAIHRWLWARRWNTLTDAQVMQYTNNLSRLSVDVVEDLARRHRSLSPYILSRSVSVGTFDPTAGGAGGVDIAATAHSRPLLIDPVGWTRELARIAQRQYGVEFLLGERLVDSTTYLRYSAEMVSTLRFARETDGHTEFNNRRFDVVVLTAGTHTGPLTWGSSQLPIIGLSGCSVALKANSSAVASSPLAGALDRVAPGLVSLSPGSHLVAYKLPARDDAESNAEDSIILQGLMSFDSTVKSEANVVGMLKCLEKYLRVKCSLHLPLLQEYQQQRPRVDEVAEAASAPIPHMRAARYIRSFTPDGVPLITNNGAAFNSFVCAGFGDHVADMAPGSARILAKLIEAQASVMLHSDEEELQRGGKRIDPVMTERRLVQLHQELQMLWNGWLATAAPPPGQEVKTFGQNPFSVSRFAGVVRDKAPEVTHTSFLCRLSTAETALVRASEPWGHYLNKQAIKLARQDNMPDWLRTIVYYYFNAEEDDEELRRSRQQYAEGIRRIREEFEGNTRAASSSLPCDGTAR